MNPTLKTLLTRMDPYREQFADLRVEVEKVILVADIDPEMALTRTRKILERVVREIHERNCGEPAGCKPLENLLHRLVKEGYFPHRLEVSATTVRMLGNIATHRFDQSVTSADVCRSLADLMEILTWYCQEQCPASPVPTTRAPPPAPSPVRMAVVPKGLLAFDAKDAEFFLELLPGPRDQDGLPESVRFWKHRIEASDELSFGVGVVFGPSGCGKSSLVKAGLLPRLAYHVMPVYIEATAEDTENRLMRGLRKKCPKLPPDLSLADALLALRQGVGLNPGSKIVIIVDQFEQWLHARQDESQTLFAQALRQCDGERVQCLILVRDDFWMALTRFVATLDIDLVQGQNLAAVDLFDLDHARRVLVAFGRAYRQLGPELSRDNDLFLNQAVEELADKGRIISIRLAVFAEMVKSKPWTPATWDAVGGVEGVGVTFLEETFESATALPKTRRHRLAAQATLKELLPPSGTKIRGGMKSYDYLLQKSGYAECPRDFEEVLKLLGSELRLIAPTEPAGIDVDVEPDAQAGGARFYQLTHDYLVHSLVQWLQRKQGETPRGRAEIRLALCAAAWDAKRDRRFLPSLWEWASILQLTKRRAWTAPERRLMRAANRFYAARGALFVGIVAAFALSGLGAWKLESTQRQSLQVAGLVERLLDADRAEVPEIVAELRRYRGQAEPMLRQARAEAEHAERNATAKVEESKWARQCLHASMALAPDDGEQVPYLYDQLLRAGPQDLMMIRDILEPHKDVLVERLWAVAISPPARLEAQRLNAAGALAAYDPKNDRWGKIGGPVVEQLVAVGPDSLGPWMEVLRPARHQLLGPVKMAFRAQASDRTGAYIAASILADYASDQPDDLIDLILDADRKQFGVLFSKLQLDADQIAGKMESELDRPTGAKASVPERDRLAKRRANAATVLLKLDRPTRVWRLFVHCPDAVECAHLIHRLAPFGVDPAILTRRLFARNGDLPAGGPANPAVSPIERLLFDPEKSVARALILSLGEFNLSESEKAAIIPPLLQRYRSDPDSGLHGACEWLLRRWQQGKQLAAIDRDLATGKIDGQRGWYVNGQLQTLAVVPGPSTVEMGSPSTEEGREGGATGITEQPKLKTIKRSFAIATKEVTVKQFLAFNSQHVYNAEFAPTTDCPVTGVRWYEAAAYCNWLSEKEKIDRHQWCYVPNSNGQYAENMKTAPNYLNLEGYRLPTEAEWELACRAGSRCSRYYGENVELLGDYAWYTKNSRDRWMLPVGSLRPNPLGLFDMLGNAMEWTMGGIVNSSTLANETSGDDLEYPADATAITDTTSRVSRGGSFLSYTLNVRAAFRNWIKPSFRSQVIGFRPARTIRVATEPKT